MNVRKNEVILLLGKTGAGKSTLGNLLLGRLDNQPFMASDELESQTSKCEVATLTINGKEYDLVDTPGIFDNREGKDSLKEISEFAHKCVGGVRAILLVLEAGRITDEEKNALNTIKGFLGKNAIGNFIVVFSKANPGQVKDKKIAWHKIDILSDFIKQIKRRWCVSPSPYNFEVERETNEQRLMEIKECISYIQDLYTTKQFLENQERLAEEQRKKKEDDERRKKEYEDKIRAEAAKKAKEEAEENARQERDRFRREMEENARQERDRFRREAEENARQERDRFRREMEEKAKSVYITRTEYIPRYRYIERENKETEKNVKKEDTKVVANVPKKEVSKVANVPKKEVSKVANVPKKEVSRVANEGSKKVANEDSKKEMSELKQAANQELGKSVIMMGVLGGSAILPGVGTVVGGLIGIAAAKLMDG